MKHNWENYFDISSEYWKKVEKIYEDSESFPKKVVKERNLHHKFPRSFSKKDGIDIDNDDDNLVSLSLADHFRVHYYLWKCAKKGYRGMMAKAFVFMRKKMVAYASDETIEQMAKDYEEVMKDVAEANKGENHPMYGKHLSEETKIKMSEVKKGKPKTEECRKRISETMKGKKRSAESRKKMSEAKKGQTPWNKGKKMPDDFRKKLSEKSKGNTNVKGMHWFNNGKENKFCYECPPGFVPGRIK